MGPDMSSSSRDRGFFAARDAWVSASLKKGNTESEIQNAPVQWLYVCRLLLPIFSFTGVPTELMQYGNKTPSHTPKSFLLQNPKVATFYVSMEELRWASLQLQACRKPKNVIKW